MQKLHRLQKKCRKTLLRRQKQRYCTYPRYNQASRLSLFHDTKAAVFTFLFPTRQVDVLDDAETLFFKDGRRRVDFILVYQTGNRSIDRRRALRRANLEEHMREEGLQLEVETRPVGGVCLHCPQCQQRRTFTISLSFDSFLVISYRDLTLCMTNCMVFLEWIACILTRLFLVFPTLLK